MYLKCGQLEHSICILEDYVKGHPSEADTSVIDLLAAIFMESNAYDKALQLIEHANLVYFSGKELPLNLTIKEGICHVHLKNMEKAEVCCMCIFFIVVDRISWVLAYSLTMTFSMDMLKWN